ncbi:DUF262 domain-containing protein [Micromonospora avicenniae]|uniref:GmrSD restriction endonucleases N-terminal domain-containing protein n=1 Tax=Micromonospora avicenniae TaxID=1198245 RepID=A0A1N7EQN1_9ACTN|nr:DUF262 domain-containing protein [Micromonospora avicenniae]SIR90397.1 Protein of unknown function DUF262 [Micromonospora avicenniae]
MRADQAEIRPDPTIALVDDLLGGIGRGEIRVPAFQRPFVWRPAQMLELFDSIERGYPIGSLLLWQTDVQVPSLDRIGGLEVPPPPAGKQISYLLDGHQRVSTLFGVLNRPLRDGPAEDERDWIWQIYRDLRPDPLGSDRYRHHRSGKFAPHLLPLAAVMRTRNFLRHFHRVELEVRDTRQADALIREAEAVTQRIKGYKLTLVRLQGASLDQAVNVYARLNRTGTRMDPDQMVSALTYRKEQPSLASRIDDIVTAIADTGFGELPRLAVFRSLLAIAGEADIMSPRWSLVADYVQNRLHDALPQTAQAVRLAAQFLRTGVGVPHARFLPYSHQLVLLAMLFHVRPQPSGWQYDRLRRWFWFTSWSSAFAGATSTTLRKALGEMRSFGIGEGDLEPDPSDVQPMPELFNLNSARTKAYVTWEALEFPRRLDMLGQPFDVVKLLATADIQVFKHVVPKDSRPANRLIFPTTPNIGVLAALKGLSPTRGPDLFDGNPHQNGLVGRSMTEQILESHGIPLKAWRRLCEGGNGNQIFVDDRTEYLAQRLRIFAARLDVPVGGNMEGMADDDSE